MPVSEIRCRRGAFRVISTNNILQFGHLVRTILKCTALIYLKMGNSPYLATKQSHYSVLTVWNLYNFITGLRHQMIKSIQELIKINALSVRFHAMSSSMSQLLGEFSVFSHPIGYYK